MRFFLNNSFYTLSVLAIFFLWITGLYTFLGVLFVFLAITAFLTRRISPHHQEDALLKEGVFYAPVNGRVSSITSHVNHPKFGDDLIEVKFTTSWIREAGLYLPTRSEVLDLSYEKGKSLFRYIFHLERESIDKYSGAYLKFRAVNNEQKEYGIQIIKCILGAWPKVRVIPGDRGRAQVNFGFFGLGGTVLLYLPSQYEILVKDGHLATAGQTIVAARIEETEDLVKNVEVESDTDKEL